MSAGLLVDFLHVISVMPDMMRSNLYSHASDDAKAMPQRSPDTNYILEMFDSVFDGLVDLPKDSTSRSVHGVPVSTFVEFVRLHLSSRWAVLVDDFIGRGCVSATPRQGSVAFTEGSEADEEEIRQCIGILIPLDVQTSNNCVDNINSASGVRVLTLDRER